MSKITTVTTGVAYRSRFIWGVKLPLGDNVQYTNPRVQEIAVEQREAFDKIQQLDQELAKLYRESCYGEGPENVSNLQEDDWTKKNSV